MGKESLARNYHDATQAHYVSIGPQEDCSCTAGKVGETQEGKVTGKEELVKALVYVRQSWVDDTGSGEIFRSASVNPDRVHLVSPATHFDISDHNFVEIVFWPRALAHEPVKSVKALIPKHEISLIIELKSPDSLPALGYKKKAGE
jgi:hypothetical protein